MNGVSCISSHLIFEYSYHLVSLHWFRSLAIEQMQNEFPVAFVTKWLVMFLAMFPGSEVWKTSCMTHCILLVLKMMNWLIADELDLVWLICDELDWGRVQRNEDSDADKSLLTSSKVRMLSNFNVTVSHSKKTTKTNIQKENWVQYQ